MSMLFQITLAILWCSISEGWKQSSYEKREGGRERKRERKREKEREREREV